MAQHIINKAHWLLKLSLNGNNQVERALCFASIAHSGQFRKFDGSPYITHPIRVCDIVSQYSNDISLKVAALVHDCIEDTYVTRSLIEYKFGGRVADLVELLTKTDCKVSYWQKLTTCSEAQTLKLADTLANIENLLKEAETPQGLMFAIKYHAKKTQSLKFLRDGNKVLYKQVEDTLSHIKSQLPSNALHIR